LGYISEVENGKKQVSEQVLLALLPWYNLTLPELLREMADKLEVNKNES
jgi:transcriptional regulator with XRE-family HTH domain